jgi:mannose/cellobiose epimerase-like protein (N-acyl-D-glucosamine 2-epimerase family)
MPRMRDLPQVRIRLTEPDMERLRALSYKTKKTEAQILREACIEHLDRVDREEEDRIEGVYAEQLEVSTKELVETTKAGVNRICALLAKTAVAVVASNKFLARLEDTEDLMKECQALAAKQIRADLTPEEVAVAQGLANKVRT